MLPINMFAAKDTENDATLPDMEKEFSHNAQISNKIMIIIQNVDGNPFILLVDTSDSVSKIKDMIQEKKSFAADEYNLVFKDVLLEDEKFLSHYIIGNESYIQMVPCAAEKFQMCIMNNEGETFTLQMNINDTFNNLQTEIQNKYDISLRRQCFTCFDERTLYNGNDNLEELHNDMKEFREETQVVNKVVKDFLDSNSDNDQEHDFSALEYPNEQRKSVINDSSSSSEDSSSENSSEEAILYEDDGGDTNPKENCDEEVLSEDDEEHPETMFPNGNDEDQEISDELVSDADDLPPTPISDPSNITRNYKFVFRRHGDNNVRYLCIFSNTGRKYCYYFIETGRNKYTCRKCRTKKENVCVTLINNGNGDECIQLGANQHICKPEKFQGRTIVKLPNYHITKNGEEFQYLFVFIGDDECRKYTWLAKAKVFVCNGCKNEKEKYAYVTAKLIKKNGEECIELGDVEHVCDLRPIPEELKRDL